MWRQSQDLHKCMGHDDGDRVWGHRLKSVSMKETNLHTAGLFLRINKIILASGFYTWPASVHKAQAVPRPDFPD